MFYRNGFFLIISTIIVCLCLSSYGLTADLNEEGYPSPNQKRVDTETLKQESLSSQSALRSAPACGPVTFPENLRSIDGWGNNCQYPDWGSAPTPFLRLSTVGYSNGKDEPSGSDRPSARKISNEVSRQGNRSISYYGFRRYSDYVWQWGQFLDHDLDLTPIREPIEEMNINVPTGDPFF